MEMQGVKKMKNDHKKLEYEYFLISQYKAVLRRLCVNGLGIDE